MEHTDSATSVEMAILDALKLAPLAAEDLKEHVLKRVVGLTDKPYKGSLGALIAAKKIHGLPQIGKNGKPTKKIETYGLGAPPPPAPPPPPPRERAPKEIVELLKARPLPPAELKERLKKNVPGLLAKDLTAILAELIKAHQIHGRHKKDKNGKATKTIESYAIGGIPADDFIAPVLAKWKEMRRDAAAAGVRDQALVAALLEGLAREGISVGHASPAASPDNDGAIVLQGVRELVAREGHGALIPIRKLRSALQLPKERFDAALLALYSNDTLILHHHDYVGNLSEAERNELVLDRHGNYYVGVALRGEQ